jgi:hypothetical protein
MFSYDFLCNLFVFRRDEIDDVIFLFVSIVELLIFVLFVCSKKDLVFLIVEKKMKNILNLSYFLVVLCNSWLCLNIDQRFFEKFFHLPISLNNDNFVN